MRTLIVVIAMIAVLGCAGCATAPIPVSEPAVVSMVKPIGNTIPIDTASSIGIEAKTAEQSPPDGVRDLGLLDEIETRLEGKGYRNETMSRSRYAIRIRLLALDSMRVAEAEEDLEYTNGKTTKSDTIFKHIPDSPITTPIGIMYGIGAAIAEGQKDNRNFFGMVADVSISDQQSGQQSSFRIVTQTRRTGTREEMLALLRDAFAKQIVNLLP